MKRRTTPSLAVCINFSHDKIKTIDFLFKQEKDEDAPTTVLKNYPNDVVYNSETNLYYIPFTQEETTLFESQSDFYMDTRIVTKNDSIPDTDIVKLFMRGTLFDENWEESTDD